MTAAGPMAIYEVHLGSWRRKPEEQNRPLGYREVAPFLVDHTRALGFTHVELMPQPELGAPAERGALLDALHAAGIGVVHDGELTWDHGWRDDTLAYFARDPLHRRHHHHELTKHGRSRPAAVVLPLSHDRRSLLGRMAGDRWQQLANLRLLYAYMYSLPGKKLLFMGGELAQLADWNAEGSLDWHLLEQPAHLAIQLLVGELNRLYKSEPALHELDGDPAGFQWIVADDAEHSVLVYERVAGSGERILVALNFTPVPRPNYRVGVTSPGWWDEILNTDAVELGGSGQGNLGGVEATPVRAHRGEHSLNLLLPPLGAVFLRRRPPPRAG